MKKIIYILASLAVVIFSGCDQSKNAVSHLPPPAEKLDPNVPGWKQNKTPAELSWYVNFAWFNPEWGKDIVTQKIEKDTNVKVQFISGDDTKLNSLLVSRTRIPDILTIPSNHLYTKEQFISKIALPMDVLAKKYDPYFFKIVKPQVLKWLMLNDGHFYGYTNYSNTSVDFNDKVVKSNNVFLVRKDIYDSLGKPDMTTPEGFINTLKLAKKKFPKTDGLDLIPLGMYLIDPDQNIGTNLQNFLGIPETKNEKIYDRDTDPEYLKWLKVFNKAFKLGLLTNDAFTDTGVIYHEKVAQGRYFAIMTNNLKDISNSLRQLSGVHPEFQYIAVNGPSNSDGKPPRLEQTGLSGWCITFISNNCRNPEKAMQLINYMLSEQGQVTAYFGVEDLTYKKTKKGYELLPEVMAAKSNPSNFSRKYGIGVLWLLANNRFLEKYYNNQEKWSTQPFNWTKDKVVPKYEMENIDPDSRTRIGRDLQKIITKRKEILIKMIRARDDAEFDNLLKEYEKFRNERNYNKIQDYRNERIKENIEKLSKPNPTFE